MKGRGRYFLNYILLVFFLCAIGVVSGMAQVSTAALNGTVTDATKASVPNAEVVVIQPETGFTRQVTTGSAGVYSLSSLPVGIYNVAISAKGFKTFRVTALELVVGETHTLDAQLQVGETTTTVQVQGAAVALKTSNAEIATVIHSSQLEDIPVNGRNWATLMVLAPGAINLGGSGQRDLRFVGRGIDDSNYTFDGLDATGVQEQSQKVGVRLAMSEDAIEEFRVASSVYTADKGGSAGAQISVVTKSGTNTLHGSAYDYFRNNALDSRSSFDFPSIPPFHMNDFGGSVGGPIKKNRTFFFADYEAIRQDLNTTVIGFVPNATYRADVAATSPALIPFLNSWPVGQTPVDSITDQWTSVQGNTHREDNGMVRLDHIFNDRTSIFGRYTIDDMVERAPLDTLGGTDEPLIRPSNLVVQLTHVFSPTIVNEVRGGFNRSAMHHYFFGTSPVSSVVPNEYDGVSVGGFDTPSTTSLDEEIGTTLDIYDDLSIVKGRHNIKLGMGFERHRLNNSSEAQFADVTLTYANAQNFINNVLDDYFYSGELTLGGNRRSYIMPYVEDIFKVRPNLTLDLGLRWEYYTVLHETFGRIAVTSVQCGGFCPAGTPLYFPDYKNFGPRVGVAWQPGGTTGKTVIRAGFGIYYSPNQMDDFSDGHESTAQRIDVSSADVPGLAWPVTPSELTAPFYSPKVWDQHRRDGYFNNWDFTVQRMLPGHFLGQVAYDGSQGHRLFGRLQSNLINPVTGLRPIPTFGQYGEKTNIGNSNFHSLQIGLRRQLTNDWSWQTEYMWSHALADQGFGAGDSTTNENMACLKCDYSSTDIDVRHSLSVNSVYVLPFGPGKHFLNGGGAMGKLIGGWQLSGIASATSGRPLNILIDRSSSDMLDGNRRNQRPDLIPGVPIYPANQTINNWLNPAAFAVPAPGTWGNLGRNTARGPGYYEIDTALEKDTLLTERLALKFRAEAFNLFNHPIYGDPDVDVSDASFGAITSPLNTGATGIGTPRRIEFMLRLEF